MEDQEPKIFSVSEFIRILNIGLKRSQVKIIGEVSEVSFPSSGHVYFTLKDEKDGSIIKSIIWKGKYNPSLKLAHDTAKALKTTIDGLFVFGEKK